ncbi:hypothetical protein BKA69DRAFT_1075020 [Paraphysoderma sedebokerense]|nr:hypothetical protein BKA69DRAFT_1075020 [Paraphysoderma sedebokerense]
MTAVDNIDNLPPEVHYCIFSFVPLSELFALRSTCKKWYNYITHLLLQEFKYVDVRVSIFKFHTDRWYSPLPAEANDETAVGGERIGWFKRLENRSEGVKLKLMGVSENGKMIMSPHNTLITDNIVTSDMANHFEFDLDVEYQTAPCIRSIQSVQSIHDCDRYMDFESQFSIISSPSMSNHSTLHHRRQQPKYPPFLTFHLETDTTFGTSDLTTPTSPASESTQSTPQIYQDSSILPVYSSSLQDGNPRVLTRSGISRISHFLRIDENIEDLWNSPVGYRKIIKLGSSNDSNTCSSNESGDHNLDDQPTQTKSTQQEVLCEVTLTERKPKIPTTQISIGYICDYDDMIEDMWSDWDDPETPEQQISNPQSPDRYIIRGFNDFIGLDNTGYVQGQVTTWSCRILGVAFSPGWFGERIWQKDVDMQVG